MEGAFYYPDNINSKIESIGNNSYALGEDSLATWLKCPNRTVRFIVRILPAGKFVHFSLQPVDDPIVTRTRRPSGQVGMKLSVRRSKFFEFPKFKYWQTGGINEIMLNVIISQFS